MVLALTTPNGQEGQVVTIQTTCGPDVLAQVAEVGGGGGGGVALKRALFVDPETTVLPADQTGAATAPFSTVQAAIDALPTDGGTVLLTPAAYPGETLSTGTKEVALVGLAGPQNDPAVSSTAVNLGLCSIGFQGALSVVNCIVQNLDGFDDPENHAPLYMTGSICELVLCDGARISQSRTNTIVATGPLFLDGVRVTGTVNCAGESVWRDTLVSGNIGSEDLSAFNCTLNGDVSGASIFDALIFDHCALVTVGAVGSTDPNVQLLNGSSVFGVVNCSGLICRESTVGGVVTATSEISCSDSTFTDTVNCTFVRRASDCAFQGAPSIVTSAASTQQIKGCSYNSITGIAGATFFFDAFSANSGFPPVTGGALWVVLAPRGQFLVNVPALAANAIGSVAVSAVGTGLEGIQVDDQVQANEPTGGIAGGGFLASCRVSAADQLTFVFHGPTAGGNTGIFVTEI